MSEKAQRGAAEELAAERLAFLANLGGLMAQSGDPLALLGKSLAQILALTEAKAGRVMVQPSEAGHPTSLATLAWPQAPEEESLYRANIQAEDKTVAVIEVCNERGDGPIAGSAAAFLETIARLAGLAQAKATAEQDLTEQRQIGRDLKLAAELQQSLQPENDPALLPIWGVNLPARNLSGDFFDYFQLDDDRIAFALGDVSGKGMNAALLMAKTVSLFRCLGKRIASPAELLEALNTELCETATRGMFVTMVAGHYQKDSGRVTFANAGHQPPLLRHLDRSYETFPAKAPPLGIMPFIGVTVEETGLDGGEFYVFTDGLTEYRHASGEELGVDGLIQLLEAYAGAPLAERLQSLLQTLDQEAGWEARDDLTVLAIDDSWTRATSGIEKTERDDRAPAKSQPEAVAQQAALEAAS